MHVLVTGAAGFLGRRVIDALLRQGTITDRTGQASPIERITAFDVVPLQGGSDPRVHRVAGDIADAAQLTSLVDASVTSVFHLAAIVSGQAEAEFDLGMRINLDATRALLERLRAVGSGAKLVMTSSVAVFGGDLPQTVADSQVWEPKSSYGTEKAINDLLLAEYSRRGWVDGRSLRMPTIVVRPGKPNRAASSFASGIIREPLAGQSAICPVAAETVLWLMSPAQAVRNILHGHDLPAGALGTRRVINMPGLSITVAAMLDALRRVCGEQVADLVRMAPDPAIEAIVNSWPGDFSATYAKQLGFTADEDFDSVIRAFLRDEAVGREGS
jgi:nucleoside-diphosphate-sugar epimerase